jgi:hypothetical protein
MEENIQHQKLVPFCLSESTGGHRRIGQIETLFVGEIKCRLATFRIQCNIPFDPTNDENNVALQIRNTRIPVNSENK